MRIELPFSRDKRYLTGMDWIIQALDKACRVRLGAGHSFQIVIELEGLIEGGSFQECFHRYCLLFPYLQGAPARDFNLAPYWKAGKSGKSPVGFGKIKAVDAKDAWRLLEKELNTPFEPAGLYLKVLEVRLEKVSLLGFVFDHRLFDARGAELFLKKFQEYFLTGRCEGDLTPPGPAYLDRWSEQFQAGRKMNRLRIAARKMTRVRSLESRSFKGARNRFSDKSFGTSETRAVFERADKLAGPFMFFLYGLAVAGQAVHALLDRKDAGTGDLVVSVTRDMRPAGSNGTALFFNHFSFLFFRAGEDCLPDLEVLLRSLKSEFYDRVKDKSAEALRDAGMLMRILPRSVLALGLQPRAKSSISFSFASTGENAYQAEGFMEEKIGNMIHLPRVPPSPGLGIYFSQYKSKLSVTLSYLDNLLSEEEAADLLKAISEKL